jgi:predicted nucleic acid-binding protein
MFLLDTNVLSETRKARPHGAVLAWLGSVTSAQIFVAAVTIGEIQIGIEATRRQDAAKAAEIERWLENIATVSNVLPMDAPIFRRWAKLMHGRSDALYEDAMIAATAYVHGLTIVTRNIRDFKDFGVPTFNPFVSGTT